MRGEYYIHHCHGWCVWVVALIVRMDDFGLKLIQMSKDKKTLHFIGVHLVNALPVVIKSCQLLER